VCGCPPGSSDKGGVTGVAHRSGEKSHPVESDPEKEIVSVLLKKFGEPKLDRLLIIQIYR
jgi:hypothetical protein